MGLWGTIIVALDPPALIPAASTMNSLKALLPFTGEHSIRQDERRDSRSRRDGTVLETNVWNMWITDGDLASLSDFDLSIIRIELNIASIIFYVKSKL